MSSSSKSVFGFVLAVSWGMAASCSSSSLGRASPDAAAVGGNGGATGGSTTGSGGGASGGSVGVGGTSSAGSGIATGGTPSECNPNSSPKTIVCTGTQPPAALIADFSLSTGATAPIAFAPWGQPLTGGTYVYPSVPSTADPCPPSPYPLAQSFSDGAWNVTGTVGTYSGMGIWWVCRVGGANYADSCLIDASAYTGISFEVSGDAGPTGTMLLNVATPATMKASVDVAGNPTSCGKCAAANCGATVAFPVTSDPKTVSFSWAELRVTDPSAIGTLLFQLSDPCNYSTGTCVATPYSVNVSIDDLQFTH